MKQCPTCGTTYTDETLKYCLADGGLLVGFVPDAETAIRSGVRVDIPRTTTPVYSWTGAGSGQQSPKSNSGWKLLAGVLIVGLLGLVGVVAAGIFLYVGSGKRDLPAASPSPEPISRTSATPQPSTSPTPDADSERLEQELANLQKQLEDILKPEASKTPPRSDDGGRPTARVNSPGDGFLALRSEPDADMGERLAQIPHGAIVNLENCEKEKVKIGGRTGRWCMVTYRSQTGWVFDAWLDYRTK